MPAPWAAHAQARILGTLHGQLTVNVLNFATNTVVNDDLTGVALLKQLADDIQDCVTQTLVSGVTQDWSYGRVDVRKTAPTLGDAIDSTSVGGIVGALGPTSVSFAASLIRVSTGGGGRSGRGRIFLPPAGETQTTASFIEGPVESALIQFCLCLAGKFIDNATSPWRLGVLSRKKVNNALPPIDQRFRQVVSLTPSKLVARVGSRKVGRGA